MKTYRISRVLLLVVTVRTLFVGGLFAAEPAVPDYDREVAPIFKKYCNGCHNAKEAEGELVLESFPQLLKGGANGAVIVPGDVDKSVMILALEGKIETKMPPEGKPAPKAEEIAILKAWIKSGAKGPSKESPGDKGTLVTPKIRPVAAVRDPVTAAAWSPDGKWIAAGRYHRVEILSADDQKVVKTLDGPAGNITDVGFSIDGAALFAAGGEPGLYGEAVVWKTADWSLTRSIRGHTDSLYAAGLSPNAKFLATGGYDQKILLWDAQTGQKVRELTGHNGPVFDLAFHPGGKILASASGDRTVKLWDIATGERLDTLNQPTKEQYAVACSPDGRYVVAGGVDNRIRIWEIREQGREGTNPIVEAKFSHEAPILKLAFTPNGQAFVSSAEDRTVKVWNTSDFTQAASFNSQTDWSPALTIAPDNGAIAVGRLDGTLVTYPLALKQDDPANRPRPILSPEVSTSAGQATSEKLAESKEAEPNDTIEAASTMTVPGVASGVLSTERPGQQDVDLYRFEAKAGQTWVIETKAIGEKEPADTRIDILDAAGKPVVRYLLRAVRDSYITFRPIDSRQGEVRVENWEEMELNQYLYMGGEICRIFRMPRGPDSGFAFYQMNGARRCYFGTSGTTHAKDSPVYIVEPYAPGTKLPDNGLPVFPLYYSNDDDGERKLGKNSVVRFTPPADGAYLVRVADVRGMNGPDFSYQLTIRPARPDFGVSISGRDAKVPAGSGQRFTVNLDRIDGFDGEVRVDISSIPEGYRATTPIVVEAGHVEARGVLNASADAKPLSKEEWEKVKITAKGSIDGKEVVKESGNLGAVTLEPKPKVIVRLERDNSSPGASGGAGPNELVLAPGTTITAMLRVERNNFDGELRFDVDNLPHGVIVDNIGLSGILVREKEVERQIFLTAASWVPETSRLIDAVTQSEGGQASLPILLTVRGKAELAGAQAAQQGVPKTAGSGN